MFTKGLAAVLVVGLVATGIAVAEGGRATRPAPFVPFAQHQVGGPSKAGGGAASKASSFRKVIYVESNNFIVGATSETNGSLKCPRHSGAINGYFGNNKSGIVLDYSAISGARQAPVGLRRAQPVRFPGAGVRRSRLHQVIPRCGSSTSPGSRRNASIPCTRTRSPSGRLT